MKKDTKVKCDVLSCKHNNCNLCDLEILDISCIGKGDEFATKKETICKSFSLKN